MAIELHHRQDAIYMIILWLETAYKKGFFETVYKNLLFQKGISYGEKGRSAGHVTWSCDT